MERGLINSKILFLVGTVFIYSLFSCKENSEYTTNTSKKILNTKPKNHYGTIFTRNDTLISFQKTEGAYGVFKWGVKGVFENISKDTLAYDKTKINKIRKIGDNFVFRDGCGSTCDFVLISKFTKGDSGTILMYPLLEDFDKNIIVYKGDKENVLVSIYNLQTGTVKEVIEDFDKTIRPPKNIVENISINEKGNLVLEWLGKNSEKTKKEIIL
ncbi:hypothetical protein [uncultured Lacinutrix sp.]|uniref:hypothetical protein n=1 Tax=uncultured Lacinutrix sp. TaxID=574032 RepID=UPI00263402E3|nr:hypothetical protein [uncultured Lacinutrix sp.]